MAYEMDFIEDRNVFKAVMFARSMIRKGTAPGIATSRAAGYYKVSVDEVRRYVGQTGGRVAARRRK